ncbi:MAG: pitrilysin family protein [bacterium]
MKSKIHRLKNGLKIVTAPMKGNPTVTSMVMVNAGADFETKDNNGLSHFLEHMCFKGTTNRPSSKIISTELDGLGAQYNAYTDREITNYYTKVDAKLWKKAFAVIADVYLNSTFPETEIEKEKGVIVEELNMYEDMPERKVWHILAEGMYGEHFAGRTIGGTKENVLKFTRDDFATYHQTHYVPAKTTIVIAGGITEKEMLTEAKKYFATLTEGKVIKKPKFKNDTAFPQVVSFEKKTDQTHTVLAFDTVPKGHKDATVLAVLGAILGSGMSSRLFNLLREELGVAYYVYAFHDSESDRGLFCIPAGVTTARLNEVVEKIVLLCNDVAKNGVGNEELKKVKQHMIGNIKMGLESSDAVAGFFGPQALILGIVETPEEKIKKIQAVTEKDLVRVAGKYLVKERAVFAVVGPTCDTKKLASTISALGVR